MIRINKLMAKDKVLDLVFHPNVSKIELLSSKNKTLRSDKLSRILIYLKIKSIGDLNTILGNVAKIASTKIDWKNTSNKAFLTGVGSIGKVGFIRFTIIEKLLKIELEESLNFGIPEYFVTLPNKL